MRIDGWKGGAPTARCFSPDKRMNDRNDMTVYAELIDVLDRNTAAYREIDHEPQGQTEAVSALRGHALSQAAKCIIVLVKIGRKTTRYVLAVVPGDRRVDLSAVQALFGGTYAGFAAQDVAEQLGRTASGCILPFALDSRVELIVDPTLLEHDEIFFNAARLDRSIALRADDYRRIAAPRIARIATSSP